MRCVEVGRVRRVVGGRCRRGWWCGVCVVCVWCGEGGVCVWCGVWVWVVCVGVCVVVCVCDVCVCGCLARVCVAGCGAVLWVFVCLVVWMCLYDVVVACMFFSCSLVILPLFHSSTFSPYPFFFLLHSRQCVFLPFTTHISSLLSSPL